MVPLERDKYGTELSPGSRAEVTATTDWNGPVSGAPRSRRGTARACGVAALVAMTGCAYTANAQTPNPTAQPTTSTTTGVGAESLFSAPMPKMIPGSAPREYGGEEVVPSFCKPTAAGLSRLGSGFMLVVRMGGPIPPLNQPPTLPFGDLLSMIEFDVGIFAPNVSPDLGGSYRYIRQYQTPDRPALETAALGSGKTDTAAKVNVAVRDQEIRIQLPEAGQDTSSVNQWGLKVTCLLRHPVDGFYFPDTRFPAGKPERAPI